jgi:hypothetical protein
MQDAAHDGKLSRFDLLSGRTQIQNAARRSFLPKEKKMMMKVRVILVCTLLLLAAVPTFALPLCADCNREFNSCDENPGAITRCRYNLSGLCYTDTGRCSIPSAAMTVLTQWKVASIEIHRPSLDSITVTAPAAVAEAPAPKPQSTELK